jgi:hypothetical protein
MSNYSTTNEDFVKAVKNSLSIAQTLTYLGLEPSGGNYKAFHKRRKELDINISHFTGQSHSAGKTFGPKREIFDYLSNSQTIGSDKLKKRLISEGFFDYRCSSCGCERWFGAPVPLELDHINGNSQDNSLSNIRLICPNCHAMTSNYRGRNRTKTVKYIVETKHKTSVCNDCDEKCSLRAPINQTEKRPV